MPLNWSQVPGEREWVASRGGDLFYIKFHPGPTGGHYSLTRVRDKVPTYLGSTLERGNCERLAAGEDVTPAEPRLTITGRRESAPNLQSINPKTPEAALIKGAFLKHLRNDTS